MSPNCKKYIASVAIGGLMAVVAPAAHATLLLAGNINGTTFCGADQNVGCGFGMVIPDADPDVNQLGIATITIAGVQVFTSQHIATYGPPTNILNSSSLQIINTNNFAVDILVAVSATDYPPASDTAFVSGSGTFQNVSGATAELRWWNDPTNQQGAEAPNDTPGNLLDFFSVVAPIAPFSFAHNGGPFNVSDLAALLDDAAVSSDVAGPWSAGQPRPDDKQRRNDSSGAGISAASRSGLALACLAVSQASVKQGRLACRRPECSRLRALLRVN